MKPNDSFDQELRDALESLPEAPRNEAFAPDVVDLVEEKPVSHDPLRLPPLRIAGLTALGFTGGLLVAGAVFSQPVNASKPAAQTTVAGADLLAMDSIEIAWLAFPNPSTRER